MEYIRDDLAWASAKTFEPLSVLVVGAGIAGLTTGLGLARAGHAVNICERAAKTSAKARDGADAGAVVQLAPNATRILHRFGVLEEVMKHASVLERVSLRRYTDNEELGESPMMPKEAAELYGAPLLSIHRGKLISILLEALKKAKVRVVFNVALEMVDVSSTDTWHIAKAHYKNGRQTTCNVIIAADGIRSTVRADMARSRGTVDRSLPTGHACYRLQIPLKDMDDEAARELVTGNAGVQWMGPGGHIVCYPIKNNTVLNMALVHPRKEGAENSESWCNKRDKQEMLDIYKDWNPLVKTLLSYVPDGKVTERTLKTYLPLPSWTMNNVALAGDACHSMLPYMGQRAANAIEDAGVLTVALSMAPTLKTALCIYELVRKERAESIQRRAFLNRVRMHLPDGPEQQKRDDTYRKAANGGENPDLRGVMREQDFMWGVDVMKETFERLETFMRQDEYLHARHFPPSLPSSPLPSPPPEPSPPPPPPSPPPPSPPPSPLPSPPPSP